MRRILLSFLLLFLSMPLKAQDRVEIPAGEDFSVSILHRAEVASFRTGEEIPGIDQIAEDRASLFQPYHSMSSVLVDKSAVWIRVPLASASAQPHPIIWYNTFPNAEVHAYLVAQNQTKEQGKFQLLGASAIRDLFSHGRLMIPGGPSTLYLLIKTEQLPTSLNFHLAGPQWFEIFWLKRILFLCSIFGAILIALLYQIGYSLSARSRFNFYTTFALGFMLVIDLIYLGVVPRFLPMIPGSWYVQVILASSNISNLFGFLILAEYLQFNQCHNKGFSRWLRCSWLYVCLAPLLSMDLWIGLSLQQVYSTLTCIYFLFTAVRSDGKNPVKKILEVAIIYGPAILATWVFISSFIGLPGDASLYHNIRLAAILWAFVMSALMLGENIRRAAQTNALLSNSLKSVLSTHGIQHIMQSGKPIQTAPTNRRVTIMFIDIVSYSLSAEKLSPEATFVALRAILHRLTRTIHQYNGVIDKSLGDGCLCFFGYDLVGGLVSHHEDAAVQCAIEIQRQNTAMIADVNGKTEGGIYPLRIGINTAEVCVGNMGDDTRFDFTLTGDGVVMASRFEAACEPFKILIGKSTYEGLNPQIKTMAGLYVRLVTIKHHRNLEASYEINPFDATPALLTSAKQRYWRSLNIEQRQDRIAIRGEMIHFDSVHGLMELINFSDSGYCLRSPLFLGKGVQFELFLTPLKGDSAVASFSPVLVEVSWGIPEKGGAFQIGVKLIALNEKQRRMLLDALKVRIASPLALTS